jgi:hypothetical protein
VTKKTGFAWVGLMLLLLSGIAVASQGPSPSPARKDPGGFRGMEWGKPFLSVSALVPYKITPYTNEFYNRKIDGFGFADRFFDDDWKTKLTEAKRESFIRKTEELTFEGVPLIRIVYSFSEGALSEVTMLFKGDGNYLAMEKVCDELFGPTTVTKCPPVFGAVGRLQTDRFWQGKSSLIHLRWDHVLFTDKTFGFLQFRSRKHM